MMASLMGTALREGFDSVNGYWRVVRNGALSRRREGFMTDVRRSLQVASMLLVFVAASVAGGATVKVENTGTDSASCGATPPCRSIAQAIANAASGDTVLVGPGMYGPDLDADGVGSEPGDD